MDDPTYVSIDETGDEGDGKKKVLAWQRPHKNRPTDFLILAATGRTYFKSQAERNRWKALQERALGATDNAIMFDEWIKDRINMARDMNAKARRIVRNFLWVLAVIENNDNFVDWSATNHDRIMKERAGAIKGNFFDND